MRLQAGTICVSQLCWSGARPYWMSTSAERDSEADTAATLGCSVNTVKTQTSRGLARLRALVEDPAYANEGR